MRFYQRRSIVVLVCHVTTFQSVDLDLDLDLTRVHVDALGHIPTPFLSVDGLRFFFNPAGLQPL